MNKKLLFILWAGMFILCAGLGFIPQPTGWVRNVSTALAVLCFLPGFLLYAGAKKAGDRTTLKLIRNLSAASLGLTVLLIVANLLSVMGSSALGDALYAVLVVISSPMVAGGNWLISLFLWACLLIVCLESLKRKKTGR